MHVVTMVKVSRRVHRLERGRRQKISIQLEALTDPLFIARATAPVWETRAWSKPKPTTKEIYSRNRNIVQ